MYRHAISHLQQDILVWLSAATEEIEHSCFPVA
jgi:hypothetical protein